MTAKISGKTVLLPSFTIMEGERMVDEIVFETDKFYNDIDLSALNAYVNIERADGTMDKISLETSVEDDVLTAVWTIDASATAVSGDLEAQISFANNDGTVVFATEKFTLKVDSSIDAYVDLTSRQPSALYALQQAMSNYVSRMQYYLGEVQELIGGVGSGGSGGTTIDANNPISASYVSGLATVATTGSYDDLTDKPNLSSFITYSQLELIAMSFLNLVSPIVLYYVSVNANASTISTCCTLNASALSDYMEENNGFARTVLLFDESSNSYYPATRIMDTSSQLRIYFNKGSGYIAIYDKSNGAYGFSE